MDDRDLQLVRRLRDESTAPAEEVAAARRALNAEIHKEIAGSRRRRAWRPQLVAAASAVVVLIVAVSLVGQLARPAPATAALTEIAAVAEATVPLQPLVGEGVYVRSDRTDLVQIPGEDVGVSDMLFSFLLAQQREVWVRLDGSRLIRTETLEPIFFEPGDENVFAAAGLGEIFGVGNVELVEFASPESDIAVEDLPLDVDALRDELLARAGGDEPQPEVSTLLRMAATALRETTATPQLRAAVIELLASLGDELEVVTDDGVVLEVAATYPSGDSTLRRSVTFDVATSALIAEQVVAVEPGPTSGIPAGTPLIDAGFSIPEVAPLP